MRKWTDLAKNLTMLTQFGLTLITPLLICLIAAWQLSERTGLGVWIYIPAFFFGLGGSFMSAYRFYLAVARREKKENETEKKKKVSFNRHI